MSLVSSFIHTRHAALFALTSLLVLMSFAFAPHKAHAAAITLTAATTTSTNASTTLAKVGDTVRIGVQFSGTPWVAPQINLFNLGSTTMSGSGSYWFYSTTSASVWTSGALTFYFSYGGTTSADATSTKSQADLTGSNVTFDKTAPTGYAVDIASKVNGTASFSFSGAEVGATFLYYITNGGAATTSGSGTISSATQSVSGISLSSFSDGASLTLSAALTDPAGNKGATTTDSSTFDTTAPSTPAADPAAGSFTKAQSVTLTSSGSDSIYYTTDGSTPSCSTGTLYSSPVTVASSITLKAIGCDTAGNSSSVASFDYSRRSSGGGSSSVRHTTPGVVTTPISPANVPSPVTSIGTFTRDLFVGASGADVKALQVFLNTHGFMIAASGPGSTGMETMTFGGLTKAALMKFQAAKGISAIGRMGPMTRAAIAAMQ